MSNLGVQLEAVEVKDLMFPVQLRKTFAAVVVARKEGLAATVAAKPIGPPQR